MLMLESLFRSSRTQSMTLLPRATLYVSGFGVVPVAEQVRQAAVDLRRRPVAREDRAGAVRPRDDGLGVAGAAADAADLQEERSGPTLVDRRGGDVVQRSPGRLRVELPDVHGPAVRSVGGQGVSREHRSTRVRVGIVLLPERPGEAPLVHGADTAGHEELARVGRQRREGRRPRVLGGRQGAVRLHREPPGGQTPVVGEEHDQPLGRRRGHPLRLRFTLGDGGQERSGDGRSTQATENQSAIVCRLRLVHGLVPFSSQGFAGGMNRLACNRPSCWRWCRWGWRGRG